MLQPVVGDLVEDADVQPVFAVFGQLENIFPFDLLDAGGVARRAWILHREFGGPARGDAVPKRELVGEFAAIAIAEILHPALEFEFPFAVVDDRRVYVFSRAGSSQFWQARDKQGHGIDRRQCPLDQ